jgi:hypothetical protein
MKQVVTVWIWLLIFPGWVFGSASPMVEKHIFLPEKPAEKQQTSSDEELKERIEFTGVLISDKGRYAFAKLRNSQDRADAKVVYQQGDDIAGATITRIGPNYLVLTNKGNDILFRLYSGDKNRPNPVRAQSSQVFQTTSPEEEEGAAQSDSGAAGSSGTAETQSAGQSTAGTASDTNSEEQRVEQADQSTPQSGASNPFAQALKKALEKKQAAPDAPPNPFLEAIKRFQQGKQ